MWALFIASLFAQAFGCGGLRPVKVCINLRPPRPVLMGGVESFPRYIVKHLADHPDYPQVDILMPAHIGLGLADIREIDIMDPRLWEKPPSTPQRASIKLP